MLRDCEGVQDKFGEAAEEMQRELDIMKMLNHENVVKIKGIFHVRKLPFHFLCPCTRPFQFRATLSKHY